MPTKDKKESRSSPNSKSWLGNYPGRTLHRIGTAIAGFWFISSSINIFWKKPDQITHIESPSQITKSRIPNPSKPITILLIVTNDDISNQNLVLVWKFY